MLPRIGDDQVRGFHIVKHVRRPEQPIGNEFFVDGDSECAAVAVDSAAADVVKTIPSWCCNDRQREGDKPHAV